MRRLHSSRTLQIKPDFTEARQALEQAVSVKQPPAFRGARFIHQRYAGFGEIEAKHEQLAATAWCAPGRVLGHHAEDQIVHLLADRFSALPVRGPRKPAPIPTRTGAMAADKSLECHHDQGLLAPGPQSLQGHPEQSAAETKPRTPPACKASNCFRSARFSKMSSSRDETLPSARRAGIAGTQAWRKSYPLARGPKSSQVLVITDSNGFGERQLFLEYSYR